MSVDRAKEIYTDDINDRPFGEVGDETLALDLALDMLVSLPAQEFKEVICSYGYDQSPLDVAWHKFGDEALQQIQSGKYN